jgi:hypothetical protein
VRAVRQQVVAVRSAGGDAEHAHAGVVRGADVDRVVAHVHGIRGREAQLGERALDAER